MDIKSLEGEYISFLLKLIHGLKLALVVKKNIQLLCLTLFIPFQETRQSIYLKYVFFVFYLPRYLLDIY